MKQGRSSRRASASALTFPSLTPVRPFRRRARGGAGAQGPRPSARHAAASLWSTLARQTTLFSFLLYNLLSLYCPSYTHTPFTTSNDVRASTKQPAPSRARSRIDHHLTPSRLLGTHTPLPRSSASHRLLSPLALTPLSTHPIIDLGHHLIPRAPLAGRGSHTTRHGTLIDPLGPTVAPIAHPPRHRRAHGGASVGRVVGARAQHVARGGKHRPDHGPEWRGGTRAQHHWRVGIWQ